MANTRLDRVLEFFFRGLRGESLSAGRLAEEYGVSSKSITRSINDLKAFLSDHRELVGNTELQYSQQDRCYRLHMDGFLVSQEMFALLEVIIGSRAFSSMEILTIVQKLLQFTTPEDREKLKALIQKELYHYQEVKHDCDSVQGVLWQLLNCILGKREITISYYRMDRANKEYRIRPASLMFADHYFYLIAFRVTDLTKPVYFRVDRITKVTVHRTSSGEADTPDFDEGLLRRRSLFMWPGRLQTIRFEFTGPSVQAVLDKLPTAKVIERDGGKYLIEAEVYGDGIKMWLLSQGFWVKVISPADFVEEMRQTVQHMYDYYNVGDDARENTEP